MKLGGVNNKFQTRKRKLDTILAYRLRYFIGRNARHFIQKININ